MILIVGQRTTGEMVVYSTEKKRPDEEELERIAKSFGYSQMLLIDLTPGGHGFPVARYEYDREPRLRAVPLAEQNGGIFNTPKQKAVKPC